MTEEQKDAFALRFGHTPPDINGSYAGWLMAQREIVNGMKQDISTMEDLLDEGVEVDETHITALRHQCDELQHLLERGC